MGPPGVSRALPEAPCRCGRRRKPACASARARRCSRLPPLPDPLRRPSSPPQRRPRHGPRREQEQRQGGAAERQEDHREWARPRQRRAAAGGARPSASRRVAAPACCWPRAHSPSHWAASGCLPVRSALCSCAALDRCQRLLACCSWARAAYTPVSTLAPPPHTHSHTYAHPLAPQVIKIGTSSLIHEGYNTLNLSNLARVCEVIKQLHSEGAPGALARSLICKARVACGSPRWPSSCAFAAAAWHHLLFPTCQPTQFEFTP